MYLNGTVLVVFQTCRNVAMDHNPDLLANVTVRYHSWTECQMSSQILKSVAMYHSPDLLVNFTVECISMALCQLSFKLLKM